jgi:hypothetical protein
MDELRRLAKVRVAGSNESGLQFLGFQRGKPLQGRKIGTDELCVAIIDWTFADGSASAS